MKQYACNDIQQHYNSNKKQKNTPKYPYSHFRYAMKLKKRQLTKATHEASIILLCTAVAEEWAVLSIREIVVAMADSSTDSTDADAVDHLACVAVIPVLVHKLLLCYRVRTQLAVQRLVVLCHNMNKCHHDTGAWWYAYMIHGMGLLSKKRKT